MSIAVAGFILTLATARPTLAHNLEPTPSPSQFLRELQLRPDPTELPTPPEVLQSETDLPSCEDLHVDPWPHIKDAIESIYGDPPPIGLEPGSVAIACVPPGPSSVLPR